MPDTKDKPASARRKEDKNEQHQQRREQRDTHTPMHFIHEEYWESRVFGALTLIVLGIVFLLNTTGSLSWSIWLNFLKLWPLFIVSIGISIIFSGSRMFKLIGSFLSFLLFMLSLGLAIFYPFAGSWRFFPVITNNQAQEQTFTVRADEYSGVKTKALQAEVSLGELILQDTDSKDYLTAVSTYYNENSRPVFTKSFTDGNLQINFNNGQHNNNAVVFDSQGPHYNLQLGQTFLPADITMKFGAGSGRVTMATQVINNFSADVGAGSLELHFSEASLPEGQVRLKNGVGSIKLTIPASAGLQLYYKVGLGSLTINGKNISSGSDNATYTSDNFNTADTTIKVEVEVGLGSVEIITD